MYFKWNGAIVGNIDEQYFYPILYFFRTSPQVVRLELGAPPNLEGVFMGLFVTTNNSENVVEFRLNHIC